MNRQFPVLKSDILMIGDWPNSVLINPNSDIAHLKKCVQSVFIKNRFHPKATFWELIPHIKTGNNKNQFIDELHEVAPQGIRLNPTYVHVYGNSLQWKFVINRKYYHFTLVYCDGMSAIPTDIIKRCFDDALCLYFSSQKF